MGKNRQTNEWTDDLSKSLMLFLYDLYSWFWSSSAFGGYLYRLLSFGARADADILKGRARKSARKKFLGHAHFCVTTLTKTAEIESKGQ